MTISMTSSFVLWPNGNRIETFGDNYMERMWFWVLSPVNKSC